MKVLRFFIILMMTISMSKGVGSVVISGIEGAVNSEISYTVLKYAYKKLGITLEFKPLPGARSLKMSNSGRYDGELFRIDNIDKKFTNLIKVPTPINKLEAVVFTKDPYFEHQGWESLRKYRVGIQIGIRFAERGTKGFPNLIKVDTNKQLLSMLQSGRIDVAIIALSNGVKTKSENRIKGVHRAKKSLAEYKLYHYLHRDNVHLVKKLNSVLKAMEKEGRIKAIRKITLERYK